MKKMEVWKWTLLVPQRNSHTSLQVPAGSAFITAREQHDQICVWGLVDPDETRREEKKLRVVATGQDLGEGRFRYLGTAHLDGGRSIFHVFQVL